MYTLLLVDDEEEVTRIIAKKVKWNDLGFSVIGHANNGLKDLESEVNELDENDETLFTDNICNRDSVAKCYKTGQQSQKLDLSYFRMKNASKVHHVLDDFDEIQMICFPFFTFFTLSFTGAIPL